MFIIMNVKERFKGNPAFFPPAPPTPIPSAKFRKAIRAPAST